MSAGESVSYEVYKLVRGRWAMHARFGDGERDAAMAEVRAQENTPNVTACCVIKESYRAADNAAMESVVYHSPNLTEPPSVRAVTREQIAEPASPDAPAPEAPPVSDALAAAERPGIPETSVPQPPAAAVEVPAESRPQRGGEAERPRFMMRDPRLDEKPVVKDADDEAEPVPAEAPPAAVPPVAYPEPEPLVEFSIFEAVLRFFAVLFLSLLGGTLFGAVIFFILKSAPAIGLALTTDQARTIILSAGLLGAVAAFFPLLRYLLPDMALSPSDGKDGTGPVGNAILPGMQQPGPAFAGAAAGGGVAAPLRRQPPPPRPPAQASNFDSDEALAETAVQLTRRTDRETVRSNGADQAEHAAPLAASGGPAPAPSRPAQQRRNEPEDVAAVKESLKSLAEEAHNVITAQKGPLDPYRCFGMTLFLAGAGETLGRWHCVTQRRVAKAVSAIVEGLGASAENAAGFAYHVDEYLLDPRFHEMYAAGRSSAVHRQYDDETPSGIADAMQDWTRPQRAAADRAAPDNGIVTVLLTRVMPNKPDKRVGHAPVGAEFVRVHDEIARETVRRYEGREIKHTGQGLLIAFSAAADAVEAASSMQQMFRRLRERAPDVAPYVSIVVAAGAPIQKTSDPRRTPIRIASALMAQAEADDILLAPPVPDMMKRDSLRIERSGTFQVAGVEEPLVLFRLSW